MRNKNDKHRAACASNSSDHLRRTTRNAFVPDRPDPELHELPGLCAHFVVDRDGTIYQLVSARIMCRHTVGLNWTAIGIERALQPKKFRVAASGDDAV